MEINASKATMSPERSLKYYIDKYGMEEGYLAFKAFLTSSNRVNEDTEFLVDIYIKHLGFEEGLIEYMKRKKIKQKREQASKASVEVFKESMEFLSKKGIQYNIGTGDNKEFIIQNDIKKYFYDFTIPSLNLIFEYQGEHVHPNPNKDLSNWRQVFTNETAEEVQDKYNIKLQAAIDEGFEVVEIWSSNFYKDNSKMVLNKIKEKLNDGEII
jgi:very-short-patch-repair endonuclease